jgi:two-component system OmpR family sensor kinase
VRRLGRRLVAIVAVGLLAGVAVPAVALVRSRDDGRAAERDARLQQVALDTLIATPEGRRGRVDTSVYVQTARGPGQPLTAVLNRRGHVIASDRAVPQALPAAARARSTRGDDDPATLGGFRYVALSIEGDAEQVGTVVAYESTRVLDGQRRDDVFLIGGIAAAGWLLLVGAAALLVGRTLGSATTATAREEAFLADAAHELRTPIAVVHARAERGLRDGATDEDLRAISTAAAGAAATIGDMLELARLDAGRALGEREPLRLDALVSLCATERSVPGVEVRVDAPEPVVVPGDERLLNRAIGNLIENAVRHGGAGGLVEITVDRAGSLARVRVADHGPGIAPGQRQRVFERFHRASAAAPGGSGLGLPIARLVAAAHGGTLELDPSGPGATFVLSLPV